MMRTRCDFALRWRCCFRAGVLDGLTRKISFLSQNGYPTLRKAGFIVNALFVIFLAAGLGALGIGAEVLPVDADTVLVGDEADRLAGSAERLWKRGERVRAYEKTKAALDLDPDHLRALYLAGRYAAWDMMRTLDRGSGPGFDFAAYGRGMRDAAIGYLTRALKVDASHRPSRLLLGLVYYEGGMPGRLVDVFEAYRTCHPEDVDAHFFAGLGHQAQGNLQAACAAYAEGLSRMPEAEQQFMKSVLLVADRKALDKGEFLPDDKTLCRFWTGRDPLFLTPVNERLMAHCARVAYANLRYGNAVKGIQGWRTDMGRAYIRYGKSISRSQYLGRYYLTEVWNYDGFRLIFENRDALDAWRVKIARVDRVGYMAYSDLVDRIPEQYRQPYWWEHYEIPCQVAQFRAEAGKTRVEIFYALPGEQVKHRDGDPGVRAVALQQGLFLFDAAWQAVHRETGAIRAMPWVAGDGVHSGHLLWGELLVLAPGAYHLAVEAEDRETGTLGVFRDSLTVRRFGREALEISDLILARRISEREDKSFGRARFMILPNPMKRCAGEQNLSLYFEVYNLRRDAFGATRYRVAYQMQALPVGNEGGRPEWTTAVSHTLDGTRDWEPHHLVMELEGAEFGPRNLRVVVEDLRSGERAVAMTRFLVVW